MPKFQLILISIVFLIVGTTVFATDVITMKNGDIFRGEIIHQEMNQFIQVRLSDGVEKHLKWDEIQGIKKELNTAHASDAEAREFLDEPSSHPIVWFFSVGSTLNPSTTNTIVVQGISTIGTPTSGAGAWGFGVEAEKPLSNLFAISSRFDYASYAYVSGIAPDSQFSLVIIPKISLSNTSIHPWVGLGGGAMLTSLGLSSMTIGSTTLALSPSTAWSPVIDPCIGIDFDISSKMRIGFELNYFGTSGGFNGTQTTGSFSGTYIANFTRTWWEASVRLGF